MNSVERVKAICKERRIPISRLEKDLEFGNGYISQLRKGMFPADRLSKIAKYLSLSEEFLLYGEGYETKKAPTQKGEREIGYDDFTYAMQNEAGNLTEEDKALLLSMARQLNEARKKRDGQAD